MTPAAKAYNETLRQYRELMADRDVLREQVERLIGASNDAKTERLLALESLRKRCALAACCDDSRRYGPDGCANVLEVPLEEPQKQMTARYLRGGT